MILWFHFVGSEDQIIPFVTLHILLHGSSHKSCIWYLNVIYRKSNLILGERKKTRNGIAKKNGGVALPYSVEQVRSAIFAKKVFHSRRQLPQKLQIHSHFSNRGTAIKFKIVKSKNYMLVGAGADLPKLSRLKITYRVDFQCLFIYTWTT